MASARGRLRLSLSSGLPGLVAWPISAVKQRLDVCERHCHANRGLPAAHYGIRVAVNDSAGAYGGDKSGRWYDAKSVAKSESSPENGSDLARYRRPRRWPGLVASRRLSLRTPESDHPPSRLFCAGGPTRVLISGDGSIQNGIGAGGQAWPKRNQRTIRSGARRVCEWSWIRLRQLIGGDVSRSSQRVARRPWRGH
jgi:hypothetical protein